MALLSIVCSRLKTSKYYTGRAAFGQDSALVRCTSSTAISVGKEKELFSFIQITCGWRSGMKTFHKLARQ